jgi:hypothetical protein
MRTYYLMPYSRTINASDPVLKLNEFQLLLAKRSGRVVGATILVWERQPDSNLVSLLSRWCMRPTLK